MKERNAKKIPGKIIVLVLENHFFNFSPFTIRKHYYPMFVVVPDMPAYSQKSHLPI